ncbi:MAG: hypothetical protein JXR91_08410 [Deltaproteobacteria bacterium]|nr:hypothetical protein [Deltaproteobacteria bacterium]
MKKICKKIQKDIITGTKPDIRAKDHIGSCKACHNTIDEYNTITKIVADSLLDVSNEFADKVMSVINTENKTLLEPDNRWVSSYFPALSKIVSHPSMTYAGVGAGLLITITNIIRFVLFIFIPA